MVSDFDVEAVSLYSYGFTAGEIPRRFTITNSDVALLVGVNAAWRPCGGFRIGVGWRTKSGCGADHRAMGHTPLILMPLPATGKFSRQVPARLQPVTCRSRRIRRALCRPMSTDVVRVKANFGNGVVGHHA